MTDTKLWEIDQPPVVVLAGEGRPALEDELRERTPYRIEAIRSGSDVLSRLAARPPVDCLWLSPSLSAAVDVIERAASIDGDAAIVVAPDEASESPRLASEATAAGATEYIHADASVAACVDRVESVIDRTTSRRNRTVKSEVLDVMLSDLDVSIYAKDEQARHLLYAEHENGPAPAEVFGKTDVEAYTGHLEPIQRAYEEDRTVLETGEPVSDRLEHYTYGTEDHWILTTKVPWMDDGSDGSADPVDAGHGITAEDADGGVRGLVGISVDVTEFKQRERELLTQIARLKQYPDFVTHDLKNPLQIAIGYLEQVRAGDEDACDEVRTALDRMAEMIEEFKTMTDRGADSETALPTQFAPIVDRVWQTSSTDAATLQSGLDPETHIVANELHLRPLLENLFKNTCVHAGPDVTVRVGSLEDGFYVEDDGPGIPPEDRDDVFEYGYTTSADGTGIGLAIVRETVTAHDWTCSVTESDAGGARFEIRDCLIGTSPAVEPTSDVLALDEHADIGDVRPGDTTGPVESGRYRLRGYGENLWGDTNECSFRYRTLEGGVRIQGRLADFDGPSEYSKALLLIRSGLAADAAYGAIGRCRDHGPELLWRREPGAFCYSAQFAESGPAYEWFRLERLDDRLYASVSTDGESWRVVDSRPVSLSEPVAVGLAVCSVDPDRACTATFEDVTLTRIDAIGETADVAEPARSDSKSVADSAMRPR